MPKELPLPTMLVQRLVMLANSAGLSVAWLNGVSVVANEPGAATVPVWELYAKIWLLSLLLT